jgi:septum formation protein
MKSKFILASASPRRKDFLDMIGLDFEVIPSAVEEVFLEKESPKEHVVRLSREKAFPVAKLRPRTWVLGADTVVSADGEIFGKPRNEDDAKKMLEKLSGKAHQVITGFTLLQEGHTLKISETVESVVIFKDLSSEEIAWYIATQEPFDKAGGYAAQGIGACLIREIRGSYTNVVGLPLCEVLEALKQVGAVKLW